MISLPPDFTKRIKNDLGKEADLLIEELQKSSPTSIRLNPSVNLKITPFQDLIENLVPWCENGIYLKERPVFTTDPALHTGAYYVQEASSMFLYTVIKQFTNNEPVKVLDLCAAPGGKSTLISSILPENSILVANEVIKPRAQILKENIIKWGTDNTIVTSNDPSDFSTIEGLFDIILVDAPCSGEGMFRKDDKAIQEWSLNNLKLCEERQKRIISNIWNTLKPNGYFIYSTCTYNKGENEENLQWIIDNFDASPVKIDHKFENIVSNNASLPFYKFYPHKVKGEGLFIGVLQKKHGNTYAEKRQKKSNIQFSNVPEEFKPYLRDSDNYLSYINNEIIGIIPKKHSDLISLLESRLNIIYKGVELGEIIKKKIKPSHSLALYSKLNRQNISLIEVDKETALQYLRKNDIQIEAPGGQWSILTNENLTLGWIKEVGNRINNYYPKEWRIRNL